MQSPLIQRVKQDLSMRIDDLLIAISCGIVLASLTIAFIL